MKMDEIAVSDDVSALYETQKAAKAAGDTVTERAAGRRLRELAGGDGDAQAYRPVQQEGTPVIVSPVAMH